MNVTEDTVNRIADALLRRQETIVWISHARTKELLKGPSVRGQFHVIEPQSHVAVLSFLQSALFVITDSGGLIREATLMQKRIVIIRPLGAWRELVENKVHVACPFAEKLEEAINEITTLPVNWSDAALFNPEGAGLLIKGIRRLLKDRTNE
jgi:UDP-N-acetylglucosamine 2-epimerase